MLGPWALRVVADWGKQGHLALSTLVKVEGDDHPWLPLSTVLHNLEKVRPLQALMHHSYSSDLCA